MQLTKKREDEMTKYLQERQENGDIKYVYVIGLKQSGSRFFSNKRFLWVDIIEGCINYSDVGKFEPFQNGNVLVVKGSMKIGDGNFRYEKMQVKQPSLRVWEENSSGENKGILKDWCFAFQNLKLVDDIISIIKNLRQKEEISKNSKKVEEQLRLNSMQNLGKDEKVNENVQKNFIGESNMKRNLDTSVQLGKETKNVEYFDEYEQRIISVSAQPLSKSSKPKKDVVIPLLKIPNSSNSPQKSAFKYPFAQGNNSSDSRIPQVKQRFPQSINSMANSNIQTRQLSPKHRDLSQNKISGSISMNNNYRGSMRKMSDQENSLNSSLCINIDMKGNEYRDLEIDQRGGQRQRRGRMSNKQRFYQSNSLYNREGENLGEKRGQGYDKKMNERTVSKSFVRNDGSYLRSKNIESSNVSESNKDMRIISQKMMKFYNTDRYDKNGDEQKEDNFTDKDRIKNDDKNGQNIGCRTFKYSQSNESEYENKNVKSGILENDKEVHVVNMLNSKQIQEEKNQNSGEDWNSEQQGDVMTAFEKGSQNEMKVVRNRRNSRSEIDVHDWKDRGRDRDKDRDRDRDMRVDSQIDRKGLVENGLGYQRMGNRLEYESVRQKQYPNRSMYKSKAYDSMVHVGGQNYIDWNRLFYNSNYSMKIYDDFVKCCKEVVMTSIFGQDVKYLSSKGVNFKVYSNSYLGNEQLGSSYRCQIPERFKERFKQYEQKQRNMNVLKQNIKNGGYGKQKLCFVQNFGQDINNLIFMYSKSKNEVERLRKIWESSKKIMESILVSQLRGKICGGLSCLVEYAGCTVYCEAAIEYSNEYQQIEQNNEKSNSIMKQLKQLLNMKLQRNNYKLYQSNFGVNGNSCIIINIINPLYLVFKGNQLLDYYTNYLNPQEQVCVSLHEQFLSQINTGMVSGQAKLTSGGEIFSICGAQNYYQKMGYYGVCYCDVESFYKKIKSEYYKEMMVSQLCADVFVYFLCSSLNQQILDFIDFMKKSGDKRIKNKQNVVEQYVNSVGIRVGLFKTMKYTSFGFKKEQGFKNNLSVYMQFYKQVVYVWLDCFLSYNGEISELLWDQIMWTVWTVYGVDVFGGKNYRQKEGILGGYLLSFIMHKLGLQLAYGNTEQNKNQFPSSLNYIFIQQNVLGFLKTFGDYESISFVMKVHQLRGSFFDEKYLLGQQCILRDLINCGDLGKQQACVISGSRKYLRKIDMRVLGGYDVEGFLQDMGEVDEISGSMGYLFPYVILYVVRNYGLKHPLYRIFKKMNGYFSWVWKDGGDSGYFALIGYTNVLLQIEMNLMRNYFCQVELVNQGYYLLRSIVEENGFWGGDSNVFMGKIYVNLAILFLESEAFQQSIRFYRCAIVIIKRVYPFEQVLADRLCFLSELLIMIGKYNEALKEFDEALLIYYEIFQNRQCLISRKLVCLKYIRVQNRRSQILLKISKQLFQQQTPRSFNNFSPKKSQSNQISEIVDGVLSVLEQVQQCLDPQIRRDKTNVPLHSIYKKRMVNFMNFGKSGLINPLDISTQVIQILLIIYRTFELSSNSSYLGWFIKQHIMNRDLLKVLGEQYESFKIIMRMFMKYNLRNEYDLGGGREDRMGLRILFESLMDIQNGGGQLLSTKQAHQFLYNNYVNKEQRLGQRNQNRNLGKVVNMQIKLFKKIQWFLTNISKQMNEIINNKLFDKHRSLNKHPRSQGEQILVIIECLGVIVGFEFLIAGIEDDSYGFNIRN